MFRIMLMAKKLALQLKFFVIMVNQGFPVTALAHFKENKESYVLVISDLRMPQLT